MKTKTSTYLFKFTSEMNDELGVLKDKFRWGKAESIRRLVSIFSGFAKDMGPGTELTITLRKETETGKKEIISKEKLSYTTLKR